MRIYNTIEELQKDIVDNLLRVDDDITINFNLNMPELNIAVRDISAKDITVRNIKAIDFRAGNVDAEDINIRDIKAICVKAEDINAGGIFVMNIEANNIKAICIKASKISYFAVCFAYESLVCTSIEGRRCTSKHFCLDEEIQYIEEEPKEVTLTLTAEQLAKVRAVLENE